MGLFGKSKKEKQIESTFKELWELVGNEELHVAMMKNDSDLLLTPQELSLVKTFDRKTSELCQLTGKTHEEIISLLNGQ